jgi:hypothetical protein
VATTLTLDLRPVRGGGGLCGSASATRSCSRAWLRAAPVGGVRPLEEASCGGRRVPGDGVVLRLRRWQRQVVTTTATVVGCSLCHGGMVGAPTVETCDFERKLL